MATPIQRRYLKERLAALSALQVEAKRARKRLPEATLAALRREITGKDDPSWNAAYDVMERRAKITACLNLYHELRGSDHRHGVRRGWEWSYELMVTLLRQHLSGIA